MSDSTKDIYLIAGGTGGIGSEVARRLRARGEEVAVAARDESRLAVLAAECGARTTKMDATQPADVSHAIDQALGSGGRLAGVVNCIGTILLKPAHLTSDEEWMDTLNANLTTSFLLLREAAKRMVHSGGGSIVLCSTVAAGRGLFNHDALAAAKAGVEGLTRASAATYARYPIRVNCVAPGLVHTPLSHFLTSNEAVNKASRAMHPLGRLGEPGDVASAICWLLSPEQSWVTGQVLHIDGGMSAVQAR